MRCAKCKTPIALEAGIKQCPNPRCSFLHFVYERPLVLGKHRVWDCLCVNKEDDFAKRFILRKILGAGAHAVTIEAVDSLFRRDVAVRIMRRANLLKFRTKEEQLIDEARAYAKVDHPNVARLFELSSYFDSYKKEKVPFLVMQLIKGKTLLDHLKNETLPKSPNFVQQFVLMILDTLIHCHSMGVYHGDLHEGNIIVTEAFVPVLLDFSVSDFRRIIPALRKRKIDFRSMVTLCRRMYEYCGEEHKLKFISWEESPSIEQLRNAYLNGLELFLEEEKLTHVLTIIEEFNSTYPQGNGLIFDSYGHPDAENYVCNIWQITKGSGVSVKECVLQAIQCQAPEIKRLCENILKALLEAADRIVCVFAPSKFRRSDIEPIYPEISSFKFDLTDGDFATSLKELLPKLEKSTENTVKLFLTEWLKRVNTWHFQQSKRVLDVFKEQ